MASKKTVFGPAATTLAVLCGAVVWGGLFAFLGAITQRPWIGGACGAVLGAIIGYGFAKNAIGRVIVWVSVFALVGAVTGPGCDADACTSAVGASVIGAILGWFGWIGVLMLLLGGLGAGLGDHIGGGIGAVAGMVLGVMSGWIAVYFDKKSVARLEEDNSSAPAYEAPPAAPDRSAS